MNNLTVALLYKLVYYNSILILYNITEKIMKIIAYKYDADHHCIDCTKQKFKQPLAIDLDIDDNGIGMEIEDSEGNIVSPLFNTDEWTGYNGELGEFLSCGTCHKLIARYTKIATQFVDYNPNAVNVGIRVDHFRLEKIDN